MKLKSALLCVEWFMINIHTDTNLKKKFHHGTCCDYNETKLFLTKAETYELGLTCRSPSRNTTCLITAKLSSRLHYYVQQGPVVFRTASRKPSFKFLCFDELLSRICTEGWYCIQEQICQTFVKQPDHVC